MNYNFGIYHWRRYVDTLVGIMVAVGIVAVVRTRTENAIVRALVLGLISAVVLRGGDVLMKLLNPAPWSVSREKYDVLAARLPLSSAKSLLDVGCGTGRSLVGLAPHVPANCSVTGLDLYTNEIILGNAPTRAAANAARAGLNATILRGDSTALPFADGSQDIVTACRLLHDLSEEDIRRTLAEAHRVCAPDGTFGTIELPIVPDDVADAETYWQRAITDAGFSIETVDRLPWKDDRDYVIITATP